MNDEATSRDPPQAPTTAGIICRYVPAGQGESSLRAPNKVRGSAVGASR